MLSVGLAAVPEALEVEGVVPVEAVAAGWPGFVVLAVVGGTGLVALVAAPTALVGPVVVPMAAGLAVPAAVAVEPVVVVAPAAIPVAPVAPLAEPFELTPVPIVPVVVPTELVFELVVPAELVEAPLAFGPPELAPVVPDELVVAGWGAVVVPVAEPDGPVALAVLVVTPAVVLGELAVVFAGAVLVLVVLVEPVVIGWDVLVASLVGLFELVFVPAPVWLAVLVEPVAEPLVVLPVAG